MLEEDVKKKINGEVAYLYTGARRNNCIARGGCGCVRTARAFPPCTSGSACAAARRAWLVARSRDTRLSAAQRSAAQRGRRGSGVRLQARASTCTC